MKPNEAAFEEFIAGWLVEHGGYDEVKGPLASRPPDFEPNLGIDTAELFAFIGATQAEDWNRLLARHGNEPGEAQARFVYRLAAELDARGTVDVLRHGVDDLGVTFRLAYFKPASG